MATLLSIPCQALVAPANAIDVAAASSHPAETKTKPKKSGSTTTLSNAAAIARAKRIAEQRKTKSPSGTAPSAAAHDEPAAVADSDPYEYRVTLACGVRRASNSESEDDRRCTDALTACLRRTPPSNEVMYYVWRMLPGRTGWILMGDTCGTANLPAAAPAPPPVPTFGQIQTAFRALPFAQPTVNIQPEGDVTLVNLPTYFEAMWPTVGLEPGEISEKVQLLSWSIEFKIAPGTYNYDFGDDTRSGATKDTGGPYPEGKIRHTYTQMNSAAQVKVDAELTGWFRVNGGVWEPIDTVADLQNEPVVTLQVREAKARLYNN
ncbi:hypothetical protein [Janibacter sp. HTCC2649]|uniref:hypothetical protein n=1 Tax=Janibacter sp. HTCC2649 TaxID=313589 RepID=UPI0011D24452|nr:hypothetical protein [Janibacter sp. HTCC2649]